MVQRSNAHGPCVPCSSYKLGETSISSDTHTGNKRACLRLWPAGRHAKGIDPLAFSELDTFEPFFDVRSC